MKRLPPAKEKPAVGSGPIQTFDYRELDYIARQNLLAGWEREETRLATEYQRTGTSAHLTALETHKAAMDRQIRRWNGGAQ